MNETKWTPGPWGRCDTTLSICRLIISVEDVEAIEINEQQYGVIAYLPNDSEQETQSANAALIVKAPDLYAGVERAIRAMRFASTPEGHSVHYLDIANELEALC